MPPSVSSAPDVSSASGGCGFGAGWGWGFLSSVIGKVFGARSLQTCVRLLNPRTSVKPLAAAPHRAFPAGLPQCGGHSVAIEGHNRATGTKRDSTTTRENPIHKGIFCHSMIRAVPRGNGFESRWGYHLKPRFGGVFNYSPMLRGTAVVT